MIRDIGGIFLIVLLCLTGCLKKLETRYDDGQLKEQYEVRKNKVGSYIKHGKYIRCYENGKKQQEGIFKNDKENGKHTFWYDNGHKSAQGEFNDSKRVGV